MDTLAPWHEREGKLPWALEPPAASSRLRGERSLSDQKLRGGERLEPPPPGSVFQASSFPQTQERKEGQGRGGASRLHLSPRRAMSAAKAWLVERTARDRTAWGRAPQHCGAGGSTANSSDPRQVRAREGRALDNPILRNPQQSRLESPRPVHIRARAQTRRGAAGAHASWKFPQQVLVAPLVEN